MSLTDPPLSVVATTCRPAIATAAHVIGDGDGDFPPGALPVSSTKTPRTSAHRRVLASSNRTADRISMRPNGEF